MITDWINALGDAAPKILGAGALTAVFAFWSRRDNRRLNERQARRMFDGNRRPIDRSCR